MIAPMTRRQISGLHSESACSVYNHLPTVPNIARTTKGLFHGVAEGQLTGLRAQFEQPVALSANKCSIVLVESFRRRKCSIHPRSQWLSMHLGVWTFAELLGQFDHELLGFDPK